MYVCSLPITCTSAVLFPLQYSSNGGRISTYPHRQENHNLYIFTWTLHGLQQFWPFQLLGPDTALRQNLSLGLTTNLFRELQVP